MDVYFDTHKGRVRDNNEDSFIVVDKGRFRLYAVADGMGGHKAGEIASNIVVDVLKEYFNCESDDFKVPKFINEIIIIKKNLTIMIIAMEWEQLQP